MNSFTITQAELEAQYGIKLASFDTKEAQLEADKQTATQAIQDKQAQASQAIDTQQADSIQAIQDKQSEATNTLDDFLASVESTKTSTEQLMNDLSALVQTSKTQSVDSMADLVNLVDDTQTQALVSINDYVLAVESSKSNAVTSIENFTETADFEVLVDNIVSAYLNDNPNTGEGINVAALDANTSAVESNTTATDANTQAVGGNTEATTNNTNALNTNTAITTNNIDILTANTDATTGNTNELAGLKAAIDANTAALNAGGGVTEGEFTGEVGYQDISTGYVDGLSSTITNLLSPDNPDNQSSGYENDFNIAKLAELGGSTSTYGQDANFAGQGGTCPFDSFSINVLGGQVITVDTSFICMYSRPLFNLMMTIIILLTLVVGFRYVTR